MAHSSRVCSILVSKSWQYKLDTIDDSLSTDRKQGVMNACCCSAPSLQSVVQDSSQGMNDTAHSGHVFPPLAFWKVILDSYQVDNEHWPSRRVSGSLCPSPMCGPSVVSMADLLRFWSHTPDSGIWKVWELIFLNSSDSIYTFRNLKIVGSVAMSGHRQWHPKEYHPGILGSWRSLGSIRSMVF